MEAGGVRLNCILATLMMKAAGSSGLVDVALRVFRRTVWGPARSKPNREAFLTICRVCLEHGALDEALHAYEGMRKAGGASGAAWRPPPPPPFQENKKRKLAFVL
jgi:hypothetical protein